tara:strand:- start:700 stop:894 length:195 start_codon:yes stop_codon:yes gene_type:complete
MSFRDNYYEYLNDNDWVSHTTGKHKINTMEEKLIELTKVVESLQSRIEVLESIEEKDWENKLDT